MKRSGSLQRQMSPAEIFVLSVKSGEPFQQSQVRLRFAMHGLRIDHSKD